MGIGQVRRNLESHIIQSVTNFAIVLGSIVFVSTVSLNTVAFSVSVGMGVSTVFLVWRKQKVFKHFNREELTDVADSDGINLNISEERQE